MLPFHVSRMSRYSWCLPVAKIKEFRHCRRLLLTSHISYVAWNQEASRLPPPISGAFRVAVFSLTLGIMVRRHLNIKQIYNMVIVIVICMVILTLVKA